MTNNKNTQFINENGEYIHGITLQEAITKFESIKLNEKHNLHEAFEGWWLHNDEIIEPICGDYNIVYDTQVIPWTHIIDMMSRKNYTGFTYHN